MTEVYPRLSENAAGFPTKQHLWDRTVAGYEGLLLAQDCLPTNDARDNFAADYSVLGRHWEALAPDPV